MSETIELPTGTASDGWHGRGTWQGSHLWALLRVGGALTLLALGLMLWRWEGGARRAGRPEDNLATLVQRRYGLIVDPGQVQIPAGLPGGAAHSFRYRDVFFLARRSPAAPRDVYWLSVRFSPAGIPLGSRALVNLSRTPAIDEPTLISSGRLVAYVIPAGDRLGAVVVVDARGDRPGGTISRLRRLTSSISNFQETGHLRGYGRHGLEPREAVREVILSWSGPRRLKIQGRASKRTLVATLDCDKGLLVEGSSWLMYQPPIRGEKPLFNWLVDTVRRLPGVGPKKIEWMEVALYTLVDLFRRKVRGVGASGGTSESETASGGAVAMAHDLYRPARVVVKASRWPPAPLRPIIARHPANEGRWFAPPRSLIKMNPGAPVPVLETFIHPDPRRPYSAVGVLIWDPRQVDLGFVAGTREPESTTGLRGWGRIPRDRKLGRVIAAFNGGFQTMHGEWGMKVRGRLIREPMKWAATVAKDRSGRLLFGTWERGDKKVPAEIVSFRQNLAPLIEDDVINPLKNRYWGVAVRNRRERIHIVRSGICFTKEGHGAYLWGKAVSLETLARAMKMARCQYGMQMDINRTNASLEWYRIVRRSEVKGDPPPRIRRGGRRSWGLVPGAKQWVFYARSWLPGMYTLPFPRFIRRDWRDFFYLSLKPVLPGPSLAPVARPARPGEGVWTVGGLPLGRDPFPARIATTFIRPDPGLPGAVVQLVKLDPRRLRFLSVGGGGGVPVVPRAAATLIFGAFSPPGLVVGGKILVPPTPGRDALLVERGPLDDDAPRARIGAPATTPDDHRQLLVIAGARLGEGPPPAAASTPASPSPRSSASPRSSVAGSGAGVRADPGRASALGVDADGYICYGVTAVGSRAGRLLKKALELAGCAKAIRLPDRPAGGPLVIGPVAGRIRLLPGDRAGRPGAGHAVGMVRAHYSYSKRLMVGVAQRPARVQFSISRKEALRLYRQRMRLQKGSKTP